MVPSAVATAVVQCGTGTEGEVSVLFRYPIIAGRMRGLMLPRDLEVRDQLHAKGVR